MAVDLRTYVFLDSLQLQNASFTATISKGGTNNGDKNLGRDEYGIEMVKECGLTWQDMFLPKPDGEKAAQRKGMS